MVNDIKALVDCDWQVRFTHIYRDGNTCMDTLARMGSEDSMLLRVWDSPPNNILRLLLTDRVGTVYLRL